ncbi:MAG: cytochrome c5 family protein [Gammaproteobacteria bacterium]
MKILTLPNLKINVSKLTLILFTTLLTQNAFAADYPAKGNFQQGSITWAENCGRCHNIRSANELTDVQWITTVFHMRVRAGLTGQETRDVLTFLQESNTPIILHTTTDSSNKTSKLSGKEVYEQTCIACHGADGTGPLPGVPNFTNKSGRLAKSDKVLIEHITNGFQSSGSAMAMPPKGGNPNLSEKNIKDILKYIRKQFGG